MEFGYPFVAQNLEEMADMLDRLRNSAALRQEASRILLSIAKYLSVRPGPALSPAPPTSCWVSANTCRRVLAAHQALHMAWIVGARVIGL